MASILIKCTKEGMNILTVDSEGKQNFLIINNSEKNIKVPNCRKTKVPVCSACSSKRKINDLDCGEPRGQIPSLESPEDKPVKRKINDPDCGEPGGQIPSLESPKDKIKPHNNKGQREIDQQKTSTIQLMTRKNKNRKWKIVEEHKKH